MLRYQAGIVPSTAFASKSCFKLILEFSNIPTVPARLVRRDEFLVRELAGRECCRWCWEVDGCRSFLFPFLRTR